ncbi:putative RDD family membrane protein YckC [Lipingzhangella halophila]|uniref:Putative RDD family membrane protein YckC n=1 Tax=Lipingzhangella halophila TaxID=1783352 RepID=A0A7W7RDE6_9ACTN|nr:RDD family protein [Lipingzhangella halophila]MBB4929765.1 putative RDD family membrane protein YckC [Lipingzhangella halophila]
MYPPGQPYPQYPGYPAQAPYPYPSQGGYPWPVAHDGYPYGAYQGYYGYVPYTGPELAGYGRRAVSYLVDLVITVVLGTLCVTAWVAVMTQVEAAYSGEPPVWTILLMLLVYPLSFAVVFLYRWLPHAGSGKTLGKRLAGIRLVKETTGQSVGKGASAGRELIYFAVAYMTCIGIFIDLLWPLWDDKNQTLHDKAISGIVIRD